jgi:hypothetical protein
MKEQLFKAVRKEVVAMVAAELERRGLVTRAELGIVREP